MLEAKIAEKDMKFKSISLQRNRRHIRIDSVEFIERLTQHISTRLKATAFTKQSTKTVQDGNHKMYKELIDYLIGFSILNSGILQLSHLIRCMV